MKFQYLAVIFVIIIVPITIVLSFYAGAQIDVINKQTKYTAKLNDATYDAVKAFQINTTNSYYSSVSDSKIRDIEASVNTFYNSLTSSLNYTKSELQAFVPAMVYTLYDGYYIYGKRYNVYSNTKLNSYGQLQNMDITRNTDEYNIEDETNPELYEYGLKPFVYYSCRYKKDSNNDFVVNFTLDNFISIYGTIGGEYVTKSGYLININDWDDKANTYKGAFIQEKETLKEYLKFVNGTTGNIKDGEYPYIVYQNQKIYYDGNTYFWYNQGEAHTIDGEEARKKISEQIRKQTTSAREYYREAYNFSKWVTENIGNIKQEHIVASDGNTGGKGLEFDAGDNKIFDMSSNSADPAQKNDPENGESTFNQHRVAIIKNTIITNLITAINSYNSYSKSYEYALPELTEEDWEKVVNNVCVISFMQGMPMGGKYFNNYVVIPNDRNNEFVDIDSVYILTKDGTYHMANCPDLVEGKYESSDIIGGYINTTFERQTVNDEYFYLHTQDSEGRKAYTGCYRCIVNSTGLYDLDNDIFMNTTNQIKNEKNTYDITNLRNKYLTYLSREKYNLYKTNN